jgi:hypothetical protein
VSSIDLLVRDALDVQVPLRPGRAPDWDDVLSRAGAIELARPQPHRRRSRRMRFVIAVAALVIAVIAVGSALAALGQDPFGGLTSWLSGSPGTPAPAAQQAGFAARNHASYAAFPAGTRLRLLERVSAGGTSFDLLGFRSRSSLCLRLVRADQGGAVGVNQCVTLRELRFSQAPALVVSEAAFPLRERSQAEGVVGFADDSVRTIELRRLHGPTQSIAVRNNVFAGLRSASSAADDPIVQVHAVTADGRRIRVPFVAITTLPPHVPSYLGGADTSRLPGPTRAAASLPSRRIGWLERREPRGEPYAPPAVFESALGKVAFSRTIEPDPDSPFRVGIIFTRGPQHPLSGALFRGTRVFMAVRAHRLTLCVTAVTPLIRRGGEGGTCGQQRWNGSFFPPDQPVSVWAAPPEGPATEATPQITRLYGLAADGVKSIDLYLASGRVIPAALRDNVYTVEAPTSQFPAKLVAYDAKHRPVMVSLPPETSKSVLVACPAATQPSAPAPPKPYERLNLGTLQVNGHTILGQTPSQVEAALGQPSHTETGYAHPGRYTALFYGADLWRNAPLVVVFALGKHGFRATTLWYAAANLLDARLGRIMRMQPAELEQRIAAAYGSTYRSVVGYGQDPGRQGCTGIYHARHGNTELSYGIAQWQSTRPYLVIRSH